MTRVLLDTNAYASLCRGDRIVMHALGAAEEVLLSIFVLGELHAGFWGGHRRQQNLAELKTFFSRPSTRFVPASRETALCFGEIKHQQKTLGKPLPATDMWIAAHCVETASVLVTYDRHFLNVPGLRIWPELREQQ